MAKKGCDKVYEGWYKEQTERHVQREADPHYQEIIQRLKSVVAQISEARRNYKAIRLRIPNEVPPSVSHQSIKAEEEYLEERRQLIKELRAKEAEIKTLRQKKWTLEKEWIETYGAADADTEDISDEELKLRADFEPESDVDSLHNIWVVEPVLWAWKDPFPMVSENLNKMDFLNRINYDAYLNDKGLIRFKIKNKTREVIKESLGSWLDTLESNGAIIFKRSGEPLVRIVGSLCLQEEKGVIVELNPFAVKNSILRAVIGTLKDHGFIFAKKDPLAPQAMRARKLKKEGKLHREIASTLWPKQFREQKKKLKKKKNISSYHSFNGEERSRYDQFVNRLREKGKLYGQAFKEADKKFGSTGKSRTNPLIIKVHRLLKK